MQNTTFGEIRWTGREWEATVALPYFSNAGTRLHLTEADRKGLPVEGQLPFQIETGGVRRSPSSAQVEAWEKILQRGPVIWDEVVEALIAEYQIQRPNRVRYWTTLHGERMLNKSLPPEVNAEVMKELVLPLWCKLQDVDKQRGIVDSYISMSATWWSEGLNVYIRNGQILEVTALGSLMNRKLP